MSPEKSIVLVGLMGAGKSSIGRRLAARLGMPFVDSDIEIEKAAGMAIPDIFARHGEGHFREGERKVIGRLLDGPPVVLATGGGAFMNAETRARIKASALSIWLDAELDVLLRRCLKRSNRPLLREGDPRETLARLKRDRDPIYAEADHSIHSGDGPHELVVDGIVRLLEVKDEPAALAAGGAA